MKDQQQEAELLLHPSSTPISKSQPPKINGSSHNNFLGNGTTHHGNEASCPSNETLSHSNEASRPSNGILGHRNDAAPLLKRQSSTATDVSAYLPQLSLTESEITGASLPIKPLNEWDINDVQQWLAVVGLQKFSSQFFKHKVTGKELVEISMEFFDRIHIVSLEDRELFLSKLYELQHPGEPSLDEVLQNQSDHSSQHNNQSEHLSQHNSQSDRSSHYNQSASTKHSHDNQSQVRSDISAARLSVSSSASSQKARNRVPPSPISVARRKAAMETRESPWTPGSIRKSTCV